MDNLTAGRAPVADGVPFELETRDRFIVRQCLPASARGSISEGRTKQSTCACNECRLIALKSDDAPMAVRAPPLMSIVWILFMQKSTKRSPFYNRNPTLANASVHKACNILCVTQCSCFYQQQSGPQRTPHCPCEARARENC